VKTSGVRTLPDFQRQAARGTGRRWGKTSTARRGSFFGKRSQGLSTPERTDDMRGRFAAPRRPGPGDGPFRDPGTIRGFLAHGFLHIGAGMLAPEACSCTAFTCQGRLRWNKSSNRLLRTAATRPSQGGCATSRNGCDWPSDRARRFHDPIFMEARPAPWWPPRQEPAITDGRNRRPSGKAGRWPAF